MIDTACSSSLVAVNRACKALRAKKCSMAVAGGVNIMTMATEFLKLAKAGFLSPTGQCKPFDQAADGYCRGEGVGVVVLKRLSQAQIDGDEVLAVIPGIATNQGGLSASITIPHSPSQILLCKEVLQQAKLRGSQVGYVEAHGTGTQAGDPLEMESICQVFGGKQRSNKLKIGSIKAKIGHLGTAAGIVSLIKAILMIQKKSISPLAGFRTLNDKINSLGDVDIEIPTAAQVWDYAPPVICVNSSGDAGSNAALLLCQGSPTRMDTLGQDYQPDSISYPLVFGAQTKDSLRQIVDATKEHLLTCKDMWTVADLAYTLMRRYWPQKFVWSLDASTPEFLSMLGVKDTDIFEPEKGRKRIVLTFPGQSQRRIGCDKSIYDHCAVFRSYVL